MNSNLILILLIDIVILVGGILIYSRNSRKLINKYFLLICIISVAWATIFKSIELPESLSGVRFLNSLSYSMAAVLVYSVVLFTYFFPVTRKFNHVKPYSAVMLTMVILSFTELIAGRVERGADGFVFSYGYGTVIYTSTFIVGLMIIIRNLLLDRNQSSSKGKIQAKIVATGFILTFIVGLLLSVIIPTLNEGSKLDNYAPYSLILFLAFTGYAIVKHKLFDFRAVIVRSFGYIFVILMSTIAYVFIGYAFNLFISENRSQSTKLAQEVGVTVVLVLTYPFLKSKFDKLTNRLFYRDSYDSQSFLGALNKEIVADIELESLLKKCSEVMQTYLKSSFCVFYIRETAYFSERYIGNGADQFEGQKLELIKNIGPKIHRKTFSTEQDFESEDERTLAETLKSLKVEVLGRLVSTLDFEVNGIGYLFIGQKKSGISYTLNDLRIVEIICNELVIATENALRLEEIEQFNVTLQKKIDDATKELQASNDKLKALDEAKDEFVSMASHQLRTPLTSVKGYISMVLEGDAGKINDTQKQMLGQALFSSQRMVYLISDLLNVSRLKTGKFIIEPKPVYLPDLVESEMLQLQDGAQAKNITLSFLKPKKFPIMNLDDMKLRQVVMNFTDNAIYYTPNGGKITVTLKDKKDSVEFTVKDTGIGVPKEERHKLFVKFYRAENARKARPDGTGLGLFMAKKVIVAQGGTVLFDSKEGKGSTFGFAFPKHRLEVPSQGADNK